MTSELIVNCTRLAYARRRLAFVFSFLALFAASIATLANPAVAEAQNWHLPAGMLERALPFDGAERRFLEFQPAKMKAGAPVLIVLHGGGQSARKMFRHRFSPHQAWPKLAEREGFLFLAPNGTNPRDGDPVGGRQHWYDLRNHWPVTNGPPDDVGFIAALAAWAVAERGADPKRVYVAGGSNGGMMTFRLLIERPELFAAGVSFIATLPARDLPKPEVARPILIAAGTDDPVVRWGGSNLLKSGIVLRSAQETLAFWLEAHGLIGTRPVTRNRIFDRNLMDDCCVEVSSWGGTAELPTVQFWAIRGGGHWIPTTTQFNVLPKHRRFMGPRCVDVDGPEMAWEFLKQQRLP